MRRRAVRRWASALVVLAVASALWRAVETLDTALRVFKNPRSHRRETLAEVQDRIVGAAYMASVRRIRAATPDDATLYLVDATPRPSGAPYFALHYLAPRRVVLLGASRDEPPNWIRSRLPRSAEWVVVVPGEREPLRLVEADRFRAWHRRRGA